MADQTEIERAVENTEAWHQIALTNGRDAAYWRKRAVEAEAQLADKRADQRLATAACVVGVIAATGRCPTHDSAAEDALYFADALMARIFPPAPKAEAPKPPQVSAVATKNPVEGA